MTTSPVTERTVGQLSAELAEAFRSGVVADLFTSDFFLDGHPPFWRFQIQGLAEFTSWLAAYVAHRPDVSVVRTTATADGFLAEHVTSETVPDRGFLTARRLHVCTVRAGQISEMAVFCSGDWDEVLRKRHAAEAPMLRPDPSTRRPLLPPTHP